MDKKEFKAKIESNRNKAFGGEKKRYDKKPPYQEQSHTAERKQYTPKTSKPKPTTYEATFDCVRQALTNVRKTSIELRDFVDYIFDLDAKTQSNWFDDMLHKVGEYMLKRTPQLLQKRNIHAKYTISVNGFSIKTEDNVGFDLSVKYTVEDGVVTLGDVYCTITVYGKVSSGTTIMLDESDTWKKKAFNKKPAGGNFHKRPYNKNGSNNGYKKPYNKDGGYNKKPYSDERRSYTPREY